MEKLIRDPRIKQTKEIIKTLVGSKSEILNSIKVMITRENTLVIIVLDTSIYSVDLIGFIETNPIGFYYRDIISDDQVVINHSVFNEVSSYYSFYINFLNNTPLAYEDNIRENNESFEEYTSLKSADGAKFYKLKNLNNINISYIVPIFSGFPSLNKQDELSIYIYDLMDNTHVMVNLRVNKKKLKRTVNIYYRTLDLMCRR